MRSQRPPRWRPSGPPTSIVIYPDPRRDCWRHTQSGPHGIIDGHIHLAASAPPVEARQAAEIMLADAGQTYYDLELTIDWHPANADGWITGDIRNNRPPQGL